MAGRIVALAVLLAVLVMAGRATAGEPVATVSITSITIPLGEEGVVELRASVPEPGLGAWTVDVTYDPYVARSVDCEGFSGTVCGRLYADDTDRVTGQSEDGLVGDTLLATITFVCADQPGRALLTLSLTVFADATPGDPQDISGETEVVNGRIVCAEPTPTEEPAPAATPTIALPETGTGSGARGGGMAWAMAALVGAAVLGAGVRLRR